MPNPDHLAILQDSLTNEDISIWNDWRREYKGNVISLREANLRVVDLRRINLRGVDLTRVILIGANLGEANLIRAYLSGADLRGAFLRQANLWEANLERANLSRANLSRANLSRANLSRVNLSGANLSRVNLSGADLSGANLSGADLNGADLSGVNLSGVNLSGTDLNGVNLTVARINQTSFANIDLSVTQQLDTVHVKGPCTIGIDTLYRSKALLSKTWFDRFLEDCGVPETMRIFASSLMVKPIDYYSCFISYSSDDEEFCQELQTRLKLRGLRVWFAPEEMKGGRKIHEQLYEAIRYHDKLILVLSEASMQSSWVELEIKRARKREKSERRQVLFPIMLTTFENLQSWELIASDGEDLAEEIRQYFIPDFTRWKDHDSFTQSVDRLVNDLQKED